MPLKHLLILLFIVIAHGSAFPVTKLVLNDSVPPILMASLRMGLVLIILIPFWKFKIPKKILIVDEIPKGATGKLQRIGLHEKLGIK